MSEMDGKPHKHERGLGFDCLTGEELDNFNNYMARVIRRMEELVGGNVAGGDFREKEKKHG
ncbi:hypothetical protein FACS1894172_15820 [Spirochaetia bacterium]|nr:hypothetical protein FACS1894164_10640 [Spirochaetia bacterium]GHU34893.1 hypothetical protein FACS1894172_15820 [Spirochaetia bacterium]